MSLLLIERWRIVIGHNGWAFVRLNFFGRPVGEFEYFSVGDTSDCIGEIAIWLSNRKFRRGYYEIKISNHLCRFVVVPWEASIRSRDDLMVVAKIAFEPQLGSKLEGWCIRLGAVTFGKNCLACAMPSRLLDDLENLFDRSNGNISSLSPCLSQVSNRLKLGMFGNTLFYVDNGSCLMLGFERKQPVWSCSLRGIKDLSVLISAAKRQWLGVGRIFDGDFLLAVVDDKFESILMNDVKIKNIVLGQDPENWLS